MANPNPEPHPENLTAPKFQKGQSGNPGGKSAEQRQLEVESAERSTRLRHRMLASLERKLSDAEEAGDANAIEMIEANILRLMNDAEDRAFGKPVQMNENKHAVTDEFGEFLAQVAGQSGRIGT